MKQFFKENWLVSLIAIIALTFAILYVSEKMANNKTAVPATAEQKVIPAVPGEVQTTLFCLQLDGLEDGHLPALMGDQAKEAYPNGIKDGYNWNLSWSSSGTEPYGILKDGTLFAKESFLKKWGMTSSVAVKCEDTDWKSVTLLKGSVNNEVAYTYQLK